MMLRSYDILLRLLDAVVLVESKAATVIQIVLFTVFGFLFNAEDSLVF